MFQYRYNTPFATQKCLSFRAAGPRTGPRTGPGTGPRTGPRTGRTAPTIGGSPMNEPLACSLQQQSTKFCSRSGLHNVVHEEGIRLRRGLNGARRASRPYHRHRCPGGLRPACLRHRRRLHRHPRLRRLRRTGGIQRAPSDAAP